MLAHAPQFVSEEEYWALEASSPAKHEYFGGEVYAMAGASRTHTIIASNVHIRLGTQLMGKRCRPVGSDQRVKVEATSLQTYPDVTVYCDDARFDPKQPDTLLEPVVIVEVLSPATAEYDRTAKFDHFKRISMLSDYVLIAQDKRRIEHFHRNRDEEWIIHIALKSGDQIVLDSIEFVLSLDEVYEGTGLPPGLNLLREQFPESARPFAS